MFLDVISCCSGILDVGGNSVFCYRQGFGLDEVMLVANRSLAKLS